MAGLRKSTSGSGASSTAGTFGPPPSSPTRAASMRTTPTPNRARAPRSPYAGVPGAAPSQPRTARASASRAGARDASVATPRRVSLVERQATYASGAKPVAARVRRGVPRDARAPRARRGQIPAPRHPRDAKEPPTRENPPGVAHGPTAGVPRGPRRSPVPIPIGPRRRRRRRRRRRSLVPASPRRALPGQMHIPASFDVPVPFPVPVPGRDPDPSSRAFPVVPGSRVVPRTATRVIPRRSKSRHPRGDVPASRRARPPGASVRVRGRAPRR